MNIFKEMALSVYSYGSYSQFLKNKKGKVFSYGVLIMTIYFLAVYLIPGMVNMGSSNGLLQSFREEVPDFELRNGSLWVEEVIEMDTVSSYVYVNTNPGFFFDDADEIAEYFRGHRQVILMDSEKAIVMNNGSDVQAVYFSDLDLELDKEDLELFLPWVYLMYIVFMVFAYIWTTALFFFGVLFVALMGMIAASSMKYQLSFGQLFLLGIYSRTLPLLIKALVSYLPFSIPFFWAINFGLSLFIIIMAIQKMKELPPERPSQFTPSGLHM